MTSRLARELKQVRPFASLAVEATLSIQRTADVLSRALIAVLKNDELSPALYNVLRILRGHQRAEPDSLGMPCSAIAERLLTWDPDVTRLTDKLVARHLCTRQRSGSDRRVVLVRITETGLTMLARLDPLVERCDAEGMGQLPEADLRQLITTLDAIRDRLDPETVRQP